MTVQIAFDATLFRPGCVLLQAALGCGTHVANEFPVTTWLTFPTPDLRVYQMTEDEFSKLVAVVSERARETA